MHSDKRDSKINWNGSIDFTYYTLKAGIVNLGGKNQTGKSSN